VSRRRAARDPVVTPDEKADHYAKAQQFEREDAEDQKQNGDDEAADRREYSMERPAQEPAVGGVARTPAFDQSGDALPDHRHCRLGEQEAEIARESDHYSGEDTVENHYPLAHANYIRDAAV
jgi:hypothetical protein